MTALKLVGANFFPGEDAHKYVSMTKKRAMVEQGLYNSMALASCGYGFQWSRWNGEVSPGKVVVQVAEGGGAREEGVAGSGSEEGCGRGEEDGTGSDKSGDVDKVCDVLARESSLIV